MSCFILPNPTFCLSLRRSPRHVPTATAADGHRYPQRIARSSTVSSLYLPPNTQSPPLDLASGGSPPRTVDSNQSWRDDDGDFRSSDPGFLAYLVHMFHQYCSLLKTAPLATKSLSACFLVFLSDVIAQALTDAPTNFVSFLRYAVYGLLIAGPQGHFWFQTLERMVTLQGAAGVITKVIYDQLLYTPCAIAVFFLAMKMMEGKGMRNAIDFVRANLLTTMFSAWKMWPFVNIVNFAFVPAHLRVVFVSIVSVFWVAYLSVISNDEQEENATRPTVVQPTSSRTGLENR